MILFEETRPATLEEIRWLRNNLRRRLEDSCVRTIDPGLGGSCLTLPVINSILIAITAIANTIVQQASPKPSFMSLEISLVNFSLRIEFRHDGGSVEGFCKHLESADSNENSSAAFASRGPSILSQSLRDIEYIAGRPNRLIGWAKLRKAQAHVLIICEDDEDRDSLATMLTQNYETSCVKSVAEAQPILAGKRVDAILADYDPSYHSEGIFKAGFDESPMPVVLMAWPDEFEEFRRYPFYIDQCLPKPISTFALVTALEVAISSYTRRLIHLANYFGRSAGVLLAGELKSDLPGFTLEVLSGTASYGGGDFALALEGKDFTRLVLADIMGHGIKAKAGAIALSAIIRTLHCQATLPAGTLLQKASQVIATEPAFTDIISTIVAVDIGTDGRIEAASAGHPPVAIISREKSFVLPITGPIPGLLPNPVYKAETYQLRRGDKVAIITDGIDAQSSATAEFPVRLLKRLAKYQCLPVGDLKVEMEKWLARRLGPAPKDDWTLMIAEYCGTGAGAFHKRWAAEEEVRAPAA
ncbi:MAG: SpoIIE family protein phosphatase [Rhodomicrobium sp.]